MKIIALIAAFVQLALVCARVVQPRIDGYNASIAAANFSTAGDITVATNPVCLIPYPPAYPDVWKKNKCRGEKYYDAFHSTSQDAGKLFKPVRDTAESPFTAVSDLAWWKWQDAKEKGGYTDFKKQWGVDGVLRAIGVSDKSTTDGGTVQTFRIVHGDAEAHGGGFGSAPYNSQPKYTVNGKEYRITGSDYSFALEPNGVLVAMDRKSPQFAGNERNPKVQAAELPELGAFSDVVWLKWREATGNFPSSMRYFLTLAISNPETRSLLNIVLTKAEECEVPAWPGLDVEEGSDEFFALLGMYQNEDL